MDLNLMSSSVTTTVVYIVLFAFVFLVAKWTKDWFTPYSLNRELAEHDNTAIALTMGGYYLAVALIYINLMGEQSASFQTDIMSVVGYSIGGIVLLNLSRWVNDKAILRTFCNIEKLSQEQDIGVGIVQFSVYLATGLIAAGAVNGQGSWVSFVAFFVLGQLSLVLFSLLYHYIAPYNLYRELEKKNLAAAVAFAGTLIGFGLIVQNSASGDFIAWKQDLMAFATSALSGFVFLPLLLLLTDRLVIPGKSLKREVLEAQSLSAGVLLASIAVCFSLVLTQLL